MIMKNKFKYINRGFEGTMVFLPGWATDHRIFSSLDLKYNYLFPVEYYPQRIEKDLADEMDRLASEKISVFAYSLGAFKAVDFAYDNPEKIDKLYLFALRKKYRRAEINYVRDSLLKNKTAYLNGFHKACFAKRPNMVWFKQNLLKDYCNIDLEYLLETLDYLAECQLSTEKLSSLNNLRVYHGAKDTIAPMREIAQLCAVANKNLQIFEDAGHAIFLEEEINYE